MHEGGGGASFWPSDARPFDSRAVPHADPYSALAAGYDIVMEHVDYGFWAEYVLGLVERYRPGARSFLELGCGTGSLALEILEHGPQPAGFRYLATDGSEAMLHVAREKAHLMGGRRARGLRFEVADFTEIEVEEPFDVALLLYDGLNYLLEEEQVAALLGRVAAALTPGGLFIVDQSTPANSLNNAHLFEDEGEAEGFAYVRRSSYDPERRLHTTEFELSIEGERHAERHLQRAYTLGEMRALVAASPLEEVAALAGFSRRPADARTERIHWALRMTSDSRDE